MDAKSHKREVKGVEGFRRDGVSPSTSSGQATRGASARAWHRGDMRRAFPRGPQDRRYTKANPKAGIFPAIPAFPAFDRLWGIFFYEGNFTAESAKTAKKRPQAAQTNVECGVEECRGFGVVERCYGAWLVHVLPAGTAGAPGTGDPEPECGERFRRPFRTG
jgi:hypothetical protein